MQKLLEKESKFQLKFMKLKDQQIKIFTKFFASFPKLLHVWIDVRICEIISCVDNIVPLHQELRHPEHVPAAGVQQGDLVLDQDHLEMIHHIVQYLDHVSCGLKSAARSTNCFGVVSRPKLLLHVVLSLFIQFWLLQYNPSKCYFSF